MQNVSVTDTRKAQTEEGNSTLLAVTVCAVVSNLNTGLFEGSVESLYENQCFD